MSTVVIGSLTITEGTSEAEWGYAAQPDQSGRPALFTDATGAEAGYGGPIRRAASAPQGFDLSAIEVLHEGSLRIAVSVYRKPDRNSFQIEQAALREPSQEEMIIPPSGLKQVSIGSLPAAAWTVQLPPPLLRAAPVKHACLAWEEDGCRFLATSTCLEEDDLISVAQSLS